MRRTLAALGAVSGAVLALDLWTKDWATHTLQYRPPVSVIGDLVRLTYTRNSGVAFGLGAGSRFPFYLFSLIAAAGILWLVLRQRVHGAMPRLALALILGGALGNLVDRLTTGEVVDFILLSWRGHDFPVFNVADTAVTLGVALFALTWRHPSEDAHAASAAGGADAPTAALPANPPPASGAEPPREPGTTAAAPREPA